MKFLLVTLVLALVAITPALAVPAVGMTGVDNTYGSSNWIVCRADQNSAWISANNRGEFSPINVCQELGYDDVAAFGGTCGTVCGFCGDPIEYYGGTGGNKEYLRYTVHWQCSNFEEQPVEGEVPEFGVLAGLAVVAGAGLFLYKRRN